MKTTNLDREIRSRIDAFAADLQAAIRQATLEALQGVLGAGEVPAPRAARASSAAAPSAPKAARKRKGGKRASEDILAVADTVLAYIKSHEGERLEQIGKGLGMSTKELKLPIQKLFAQKAIKTKGQRRGTQYFVK